jgi:lipopolysaccharide transport system ATP-binding protein
MSGIVISVENVSKRYRLGLIGSRTLSADLERWWARVRGKPDPLLKIGQEDYANREGEYIWALRDVSFEVQQGEVLGIIGRNGAGKTTLLKILSRITAPTSGQVKIKGRVASLLEVGTGFHPTPLCPPASRGKAGRENIYMNGAIPSTMLRAGLGMKKAEIDRKFDEILAFAETPS